MKKTNDTTKVYEGKIKGPLIIGDPMQFENKEFLKFLFRANLDHNIKLQVVKDSGSHTAIINLVKEGESQVFSFDENYEPVLPIPYYEWKQFTDTAEFKVYCGPRVDTICTMVDGYFGYAFANESLTEYMIYLFIPDDVLDYESYEKKLTTLFGLEN